MWAKTVKNGYWTFGFLASQRYVFLSLFSIQFFPFFWALAHWMRDTCGQISRVVRQRLSVGVCVTLAGGGAILISGGGTLWHQNTSEFNLVPSLVLPGKLHSHSSSSIFGLHWEGARLYLGRSQGEGKAYPSFKPSRHSCFLLLLDFLVGIVVSQRLLFIIRFSCFTSFAEHQPIMYVVPKKFTLKIGAMQTMQTMQTMQKRWFSK